MISIVMIIIIGTNIFNEKFVKSQAELMWSKMEREVQDVYTKKYFDEKVEVMRSYMNNGITDISPVIDSYTDALLDVYPQVGCVNSTLLTVDCIMECLGSLPTHGPVLQDKMLYSHSSPRNCLREALYWIN